MAPRRHHDCHKQQIKLDSEKARFGAETDEGAEGRDMFWRLAGLAASNSRGFDRAAAKRLLWWLMLAIIAALTARILLLHREKALKAAAQEAALEAAAAKVEAASGEAAEQYRRTVHQGDQEVQEGQHSHGVQDGVDISYTVEFGYELLTVLPLAYWHHLNGSLRSTTSCGRDSLSLLYYFSPNHTDNATCHRAGKDFKDAMHGFYGGRFPPAWQAPPLANHFRKLPSVWPEISMGSQLVVIGNKYEREYKHAPVNFIDLPTLLTIVDSFLKAGFYVVYNNPGMSLQFDDWQVTRDEKDLGDYEALQQRFGENPRFQIMQNLQKRWPGLSFNDVQFRMLARSACFVSVQGGGCTLQSYFGGSHIVHFREGHEFEIGAYERIYPRLSGVKMKVVTSYQGLERKVHEMIKSNNCFAQLQ